MVDGCHKDLLRNYSIAQVFEREIKATCLDQIHSIRFALYTFHLSQLSSKVPSSSIRLIVVKLHKAMSWNGESQRTHSRSEDATPQRYTGNVDLCTYIYAQYTQRI